MVLIIFKIKTFRTIILYNHVRNVRKQEITPTLVN